MARDPYRTRCLVRTDGLPAHLPTYLRDDAIRLPGWAPYGHTPARGVPLGYGLRLTPAPLK